MVDPRPNVWQLQSRQDHSRLIQALRYSDPEVRGRAATALRTLKAVDAVPALKEVLRTETNEQVRYHVMAALRALDRRADVGDIASIQDVDRLIEILRSHDPASVIAAVQALSRLGDRLAVEPLVILFHNSSSSSAVRLAAAEALLELKSAPAVVTLLGALRRDSWQVRCNAAAVLGQIQAVWAVTPLTAALDDPHPVVRRAAAAALKRIGTAEAVAALRAHFAPQTSPELRKSKPAAGPRPAAASKPAAVPKTPAGPMRVTSSDAVETGAWSSHDTRPAEAKTSLMNDDTHPGLTLPRADLDQAAPPQPRRESGPGMEPLTGLPPLSPLKMVPPPPGPVKRLITFLKRHNEENRDRS